MKKWTKILAVILAVVLVVPTLSYVGNAADSVWGVVEDMGVTESDETGDGQISENALESNAAGTDGMTVSLPAGDTGEADPAQNETEDNEGTGDGDLNAANGAGETEDVSSKANIQAAAALSGSGQMVTEEEEASEGDDETNAETAEDTDGTQEVSGSLSDASDDTMSQMSLLPLSEVNAYLILSDYSEEELTSVPVDAVLEMLRDSEGNQMEIADSATTVWKYVKDDMDGIEVYEKYTIGNNETIDLSTGEDISTYTMELIIGSENQLDADNIRYQVKVYLLSTVTESVEYELYTQDEDGNRTEVEPSQVEVTTNTQLTMTVEVTQWTVVGHEENTEYYLGITSEADEHPYIQTDVYTFAEFYNYLYSTDAVSITDQILNQDMEEVDAGYLGVYDPTTSIYDTKNLFFLVYTDTLTGSLVNYACYAFCVSADETSYIEGHIYTCDGNEMTDVVCYDASEITINNVTVDLTTGAVAAADSVQGLYYMLEDGYSADDEYYCVLNAYGSTYGYDANSYVTKAVVGLYDSLEDAADAEDIKEELIPVDQTSVPRGYKANYNYGSKGVYFTVFFEDGSVWKVNVRTIEYMAEYDEAYVRSYTDAPIVGEADPWFQVTGVQQNGEALDTYIVENGKSINMDTMYGYGYQTVFINDEDADMSELQPDFWTADADRIEVYVNGTKINSGDTIDCSAGTVEFSVIIDGNVKNYMVSFIKKTSKSQLYVCGPNTREVFLDEYFEYKHDILIANVGGETLTGLRVELDATNCKLDSYWTVGGEGNDTLAAFTTTESTAKYGELSNLAKIRLLPDGEGEIEGTLTIYADGMVPIVITLTGRAQNPKIVTEDLTDAVKYVPYSCLVTTNNMYDWTDVTFSITSGELPEGVELNTSTGEIYGVAQETGEFDITVEAAFTSDTYTFESSSVDVTLTVLDNTNDNVYYETDDGYDILVSVGEDEDGTHDYILTEYDDEEFRSSGEMGEFIDLWLNGEKLEEGIDYTVASGSTKITIMKQTFENKANTSGSNTLAAEFRVNGDTSNTLKRTAQNFRISLASSSSSSDSTSSGSGSSTSSSGSTGSSSSSSSSGSSSSSSSTTTGSTSSSDGNTSSASSTTGSSSSTSSKYVTGIICIVDGDGNPISGLSLEMHSSVLTATTNQEGYASFSNLEFGSHTLYIKDENGNVAAQKSFTIQSGQSVSLSGDTVTVPRGGVFTLTVQYDGHDLTLLSVQTGNAQATDSVKTGDTATWICWIIIILIAFGGIMFFRRRMRKARA